MDDRTRVILSSTSDALRVLNYSMNFYLYCVANDDIRKAAVNIIKNSFIFQKSHNIMNYIRGKL